MTMLRPSSTVLGLMCGTLLACTVMPALGQSTPFDMTPEGNLRVETAPALPSPRVPAAAPAPAAPVVAAGLVRYLLPGDQFELVGEEARRSVNVYLSQAQANAPATLDLGYINAIVVAPEASRLSVMINGTSVLVSPVASSGGIGRLQATLPAGLLRAGANLIDVGVTQRHRTDCSVASTYELWTQLDPTTSVIRFDGAELGRVTQLPDIATVGFGPTGVTTLRLMIPSKGAPEASSAAVMLAQQLGLAMHSAAINVVIVDALPETTEPGTLNVVLGLASELPAIATTLQTQAAAGPLAAFIPAPGLLNTLVVSGPDWGSVNAAVRAVGETAGAGNPQMLPQRVDLAFPVPRISGATTLSLRDLGVTTTQFNGRRYRTSFEFWLPADFYAQMYGQAQLELDAAYSAEVLPGSQFNLYANGQIASATPVLKTNGGQFRHTRIKFPMTNFRPGRNQIDAEVLIKTQADDECAPGVTQSAADRFLFSATTNLIIPAFGRAAEVPDLQAFTGTGAPYAGTNPVPLMLGPGNQSLPSAMTWLARVAVASGAVIPVSIVAESGLNPAISALVVSPLPTLTEANIARSGVARSVGSISAGDDGSLLNQFNQGPGTQRDGPLEVAQQWVADRVGLAPDNLRLFSNADGAYVPTSTDAVVVAQRLQPEGGVWTYLTTPSEVNFLAGTQRLVQTDNWRAIAGRVSALGPNDASVSSVQPANPAIVQTQPFSILNIRLVAANWLSTNVLYFTLLMAAITLILTLATAALLRTLGRK